MYDGQGSMTIYLARDMKAIIVVCESYISLTQP